MSFTELDFDGVPIPSPPPRFFLAHAKSCGDGEIARLVAICHVFLASGAAGRPYDLVTGRAYYEARFADCGSWDAWCVEVAAGVDYLTRKPTFVAILVPAGPIGAGTAKIVAHAIENERRVIAFEPTVRNGHVRSALVAGVKKISSSWQDGWQLRTDRKLT